MATIFSRIIAGEIPSYKVAEDENYYAFLDINPLTKGHTLVVPKQEIDYIFDLDDQSLAGHDALRQEGSCQNSARNSVHEGRRGRFRARSTSCAHPFNPHSERK